MAPGKTFLSFLILFLILFGALQARASFSQSDPSQSGSPGATSAVTLPPGTKVELAVIIPVWAAKVRRGNSLYTQTDFPVIAGSGVAIPAGTWVQGTIDTVKLPTRRQQRATLQVLFTRIIFANGYTVLLPSIPGVPGAPSQPEPEGIAATAAMITIEASTASDLLLDNGAQIEMSLAAPLALDAAKIANAIPLSRPPEPGKFKSATLCRPTLGSPGTPGSPDTVIPGSPGTPDTTIPGGPGMPDITIPGTPATPDTVIPGMPGTPGTPGSACPAPPIVISSVPVVIGPTPKNGTPSPSSP